MKRSILVACVVSSLLSLSYSSAVASGPVPSSGIANKIKSQWGKVVTTLAVATILGYGLMACDNGGDNLVKETEESSVRIGLSHAADILPGIKLGAELAVIQLNQEGGINGVQIELLARDNGGDLDQGLMSVRELVTKENIQALGGPAFSRIAIEVAKYMQGAGIPMVTTLATNPDVTTAGDFVFAASFNDNFQGKVMANLAIQDLGAGTAAVLTLKGDAYSEGLSQTFIANLITLGGTIVAQEFYQPNTTEFAAQMEIIKAAMPDVVFIPGFGESAFAVKQGVELGLETIYLGGDGWVTPGLQEAGGEALKDSYFSGHYSADAPPEKLSADTQQFIAAYEERNGVSPDDLAALGYDTIQIIVQAMRRAENMSPEAIRDAIAATKNYSGATFISAYDGNGNAEKTAVINTFEGGKIRFFKLVNPDFSN